MEIAIVLGLLVLAIVLFSTERFSVDVIALGILVVLMVTRILTPKEAFEGFGADFIIILASIFIISGALQQTGILDLLGSRLLKMARLSPGFLITYIMISVGITSAFMNNTTVTAIFLAPVVAVARKMHISPSKLLMPVAYASILGGTCTVIGTSTNVAVSGYLERIGMEPLGMFEFSVVGIVLFILGVVYMALFSKRLLPDRKEETIEEEFKLRDYVSEVVISESSPLVGQRIFRSNLSKMGFRILNVIREGRNFLPEAGTHIEAHDTLIIEGNVDDLIKIKETAGIDTKADVLLGKSLVGEGIKLAEVLVTPQSEFLNATLKNASFRQRYGLVVLAINRSGQTLRTQLGRVILRVGDILLVQGPEDKINYFKQSRDITIMEDFKPLMYRKRKGFAVILVFFLSILLGSLNVLPLSAALLICAIACVSIKALTVDKAYEAIDWRLLILIGGMASFGTAMTKTGASKWLAEIIVQYLEPLGPIAIIAGFVILTVFLTQPMSNAAAALVVLPVAIETAHHLNANPRTFAIAIMLSASISLITPFEPSCVLVYGPGKYRFLDYLRTGFFLTLVLMAVLLILIPYFWPLYPS
ncbi:MAG: SLC13 family permease [Bacteroidia bacterium]|nr:SLC13 family permease [Bacteroidia bacterium]